MSMRLSRPSPRDGYAAGHRAEARAQGPAKGKAGDGAHASAAGDF